MIDTKNMEDFVHQQIRSAVDHLVTSVSADEAWMSDLEQRIVKHVQDRITARFSNIETVPDLVASVQNSVRDLMTQGHVPGISQYVDQKVIARIIDQSVEQEIARSLSNLAVDPVWIEKIENLINQNYIRRLSEWISTIDLDSQVCAIIDASVDRWQQRFKQDLVTHGIQDTATEPEIKICPGEVEIVHSLGCGALQVTESAQVQGTLEVQDLVLRGSVNTDNRSWNELSTKIAEDTLALITDKWKQELVDGVIDQAKSHGIEFQDIIIQGLPLIENGTLNPKIRRSQLETLGNLERLAVKGDADLSATLHVRPRRVGINTSDPEMALSVWDEEVTLVAGKLRENHAYLGTNRSQNLSFGVNRKPFMEINTDGLTTIKDLRIDRHRISFATQVPGYSGTRGDLVFNSDPNEGQPFAWVCLGAFRWQPLRGAQ